MVSFLDLLYSLLLHVVGALHFIASPLLRLVLPVRKAVRGELKRVGVMINVDEKSPGNITVHKEEFYHRLVLERTLGLGEMYMDGVWDCGRLDVFFAKMLSNGLYKNLTYPWHRLFEYLECNVFNLQTAARAWEVAEKHYNLGNELFSSFLDSSMNYSCGYWRNAKNLEEAQQHKMELIGRKLKLEPGMKVLDIGCGWGGLCKFLAEKYQVTVVGVTVSKEGAKVAQERCKGLPVEIRVQDYRDLDEEFDRIVSVGMFEHVGPLNYRTFFQVAHRCLVRHGIFLLHTIGVDSDGIPAAEPWTVKYIFPNGYLPDHKHIPKSVDNLFSIEDWHNFGQDYDKTLMAWHGNFVRNWPTISHLFEDSKRFYRTWTYYLLISAGSFRARKLQLWQVVLAKDGIPGGYLSVR